MATNSNFISLIVFGEVGSVNAPYDPVLNLNYYGQNGGSIPTRLFNTSGFRNPITQVTGAQLGFASAPNSLYTYFDYLKDQGNIIDRILTPIPSASLATLLS